jgi:hypothetical protein
MVAASCSRKEPTPSPSKIADTTVLSYPYTDTFTGNALVYENSGCNSGMSTAGGDVAVLLMIHLAPDRVAVHFQGIHDSLAMYFQDTLAWQDTCHTRRSFISFGDTLLFPRLVSPDTFSLYRDTIFIAMLNTTRIYTDISYSRGYRLPDGLNDIRYLQFVGKH